MEKGLKKLIHKRRSGIWKENINIGRKEEVGQVQENY